MQADEFDEKFDRGEDITQALDTAKAQRPGEERRVDVDFPVWMIAALDCEARRLGITCQSVIKVWLAERLAPAPDGGRLAYRNNASKSAIQR